MCENLGNNLDRPGGFAQYYTVLPRQIARDVITAFLTESAMTVLLLVNLYHLSMPVRKISMLGFHAKLAKLRGAKKVIMIEINDNRLETAKQFGGVAKGALTELDTNYIHYNGLWIYGHYGSNSMQVQKSFELAISDEFEAEKFITHILPLSEINKGIALTKSGEAIKVVLHPNDQ